MFKVNKVVATALLVCAGAAQAQTLEESYASLCSDKAAKQGETCAALRKAMLDKLSSEDAEAGSKAVAAQSAGSLTTTSDANAEPEPDTQFMASLAGDTSPLDPTWGILSRLVNTYWVSANIAQQDVAEPMSVLRNYKAFTSLEDGRAMQIEDGISIEGGQANSIIVLRPTKKPGVYDGEFTIPQTGSRWHMPFRSGDDNSILSDWYKVVDNMYARTGIRVMPDGTLTGIGSYGYNSDRPPLSNPDDPEQRKMRMKPYNEASFTWFAAQQMASYDEWLNTYHAESTAMRRKFEAFVADSKRRQAEIEKARLARKQSGRGLLGTFLGAAVGFMTGQSLGLGTSETLGAMAKGAALTNPNSGSAGILGDVGSQMLGANRATLPSGVSAQRGGGSYSTKPNLATGACAGFSESNYRTKALEGGGDTQLLTMCGQAFEYYTMYKRAIAQGASEADANRTYDAHEQSARVASGFLTSHRAN